MKKQHLFPVPPMPTTARADGGADEQAAPKRTADEALAAQTALELGQLLGGRDLSRRPGLHVGQWFLSLESLLMAAMLVVSIVACHRLNKQ